MDINTITNPGLKMKPTHTFGAIKQRMNNNKRRVVECLTSDKGSLIQTLLEALHCVLEQDTLSSVYMLSTDST